MTDTKSHLSELLSRVSAGERFLIQRRERPVAVLIGTDELERLERTSRVGRRLAAALGQDEALLAAIERGEATRPWLPSASGATIRTSPRSPSASPPTELISHPGRIPICEDS